MIMAERRKIQIGADRPEQKAEELPADPDDIGWKEWAVTVYALYWYIILCIAVSLLGMIWVKWNLMLGWDIALMYLAFSVLIEAYVYYLIWVRKKRLRSE